MPQSKSHHLRSSCAGDADSVSGCTPENRVKFLCSHGGKILPRPGDGHLKYTGGETRVIGVHRDITFSELMKKVASMFQCEMILKYQLIPDDLDVLVTVKSDEDTHHMIDECDRQGAPRLRAFLFPATTSHDKPTSLTRNHSSPSLSNAPAIAQNHHHHHHHQPPLQPYQSPRPPLDCPPYRQQPSSNHGISKGGHVYYQGGPSYDDDYYGDYRYDSPPSPGAESSK